MLGYGAAFAVLYVLYWISRERPLSRDALLAAFFFAVAATLGAALARLVAALFAQSPPSARFAAAFVALAAAPPVFISLIMAIRTLLGFHDITEIPPHIAAIIIAILGGGSLYGLLATAMRGMAPYALLLMLVFAWLIAVVPPCAERRVSAKAQARAPLKGRR